jgi:hypothetical protein
LHDLKTSTKSRLEQQSISKNLGIVPMILAMPSKASGFELEKSSIITGVNPASCKATTVCEPMYPAPPVTITCFLPMLKFTQGIKMEMNAT